MSEDMSPSGSSWNLRHLVSAGSHLTSLKGYIAGHADPSPTRHAWRSTTTASSTPRGLEGSPGGEHERQSWRAWASQKIRGKRKGNDGVGNTEIINVFPGWAARRYAQGTNAEVPRPFEVEVFVSGYAISYRSPENISRSQRAFIRLAKGFASLPKLTEDPGDRTTATTSLVQLTPSTEALLAQVKLPPRPSEITDDFDVEALERQLKRATTIRPTKFDRETPNSSTSSLHSSASSSTSSRDMSNDTLSSATRSFPGSCANMPIPSTSSSSAGSTPTEIIRRLHANLEQRLQPFWSSVLPNRIIRLHLLASPHRDSGPASAPTSNISESDKFSFDPEHGPLATQDVVTSVDGSFQAKFRLRWEELCHHPQAVYIAFGEDVVEHEVMVVAQLLPPASIPVGVHNAQNQTERSSAPPSVIGSRSAPGTYDPPVSYTQRHNQIPQPPKPLTSIAFIPITHSPIRVISDIDDTIKLSNILSGARTVFHNVFVKELRDSVIPGMGEWYRLMWSRGIRFHYVSNGPFELLPILNEFFQISQLPPGSIRLKSYAGRSLFNGLLSAPAARKRAGVVDILDSFPDSQFFLIGDTGEQDLELYADLARERPRMILGVLVRDVDSGNAEREPLDDPTGWRVIGAAGTRPSENPLIPIRSDSTPQNTSTDRMTSINSGSNSNPRFGMNFMSNAHLEHWEEEEGNTTVSEQTPRPNRYALEDSASVFEGEEPLLADGKMSEEPGLLTMDSVGNSKVSLDSYTLGGDSPSSARSQTYPLESRQLHKHKVKSTPPPPPPNKYITQPPKPIQPPCITANFIPKFRSSLSSQSFPQRIHRQQGSSTASTPDSSASSLLNDNINYGGANGGKMTEAEKKRYELQTRVYRARTQIPSHIVLRVFRDPSECVEVEAVMRGEAGLG
ncbi:hypothetical protein BYT27DRAFT_7181978 [Phlegmacium glaucopus]|nr:hypothetical protein BYT27DRAFT_7181978 [Phlegmacium glaucopus]